MRRGAEQNMMVEVNYRQGRDGTTLDTLVQDCYLCASMEFLLTVADIFLKASQQGFTSSSSSSPQPRPPSGGGEKRNAASSAPSKESGESNGGPTIVEPGRGRRLLHVSVFAQIFLMKSV